MKLRKNQSIIILNNLGMFLSAVTISKGIIMPLITVRPSELNQIQRDLSTPDKPRYICVRDFNKLEIWPAPKESIEVMIRYYPTMKEI